MYNVFGAHISIQPGGCHPNGTAEMKMFQIGSTGAFIPSGKISFLYQWNHLMPLLTRYEKHPVSTFQGHCITEARGALLHDLWAKNGNDTVSLNDFYFGFSGGFVEVVL